MCADLLKQLKSHWLYIYLFLRRRSRSIRIMKKSAEQATKRRLTLRNSAASSLLQGNRVWLMRRNEEHDPLCNKVLSQRSKAENRRSQRIWTNDSTEAGFLACNPHIHRPLALRQLCVGLGL